LAVALHGGRGIFRGRRKPAPAVHVPAAASGVDGDENGREGQQTDRDPHHLPGARLPLPAQPDEVAPGPPGARLTDRDRLWRRRHAASSVRARRVSEGSASTLAHASGSVILSTRASNRAPPRPNRRASPGGAGRTTPPAPAGRGRGKIAAGCAPERARGLH